MDPPNVPFVPSTFTTTRLFCHHKDRSISATLPISNVRYHRQVGGCCKLFVDLVVPEMIRLSVCKKKYIENRHLGTENDLDVSRVPYNVDFTIDDLLAAGRINKY